MTLVLLLVQFLIIPNVEQITQGSAVSMYESLKDEDCYVECYGFKSYAQYFYAEQAPNLTAEQKTKNWLIHGDIDKPVYLITKSDHLEVSLWDHFKLIKNEGGYKLYKREPGTFLK